MKVFYYYLIIVNVVAFLFYGLDKLKARFHRWRISEIILLNLSVIGGVFGAIIGMYLFHHKTKKNLFRVVNVFFFIGYILLIYYVFGR